MSQNRDADIGHLIDLALGEDVGDGDVTTLWTVPENKSARASIVAKADGVLAGCDVADRVFATVDPAVELRWIRTDGDSVSAGDDVARLAGPARSILTGERVALNFLQRLSGIATLTRSFVDLVDGTGARILDTRKTTPALRLVERDAVRSGGGTNHRFGLFDMVLIKENHIRAAGSIGRAVAAVKEANDQGLMVEIEVTTMDEVRKALQAGVDRILLDNMSIEQLEDAVSMVRSSGTPDVQLEASGGVNLDTVAAIAGTGVDFISVGALTHSAKALDLSLLFDFED